MNVFVALAAILLTTGCVMFPTSHLVYEPSSDEGRLINPSGEYLLGNKVLLLTKTADYNLEIISIPGSPDERLKVFFRLVPLTGLCTVHFDKIVAICQGTEFHPVSIRESNQEKSAKNSSRIIKDVELSTETRACYEIEFSITQATVNNFEFVVGDSTIVMGDRFLKISPVKFRKVKHFDVYYGSLNF